MLNYFRRWFQTAILRSAGHVDLRPVFKWVYRSSLTVAFGLVMGNYFYLAYPLILLGGIALLGHWWLSDSRKKSAGNVSKLKRKADKEGAAFRRILEYKKAYHAHVVKDRAVFGSIAVATLLLFFGNMYLHEQYELSLFEGWLRPANDPTPSNPCDRVQPARWTDNSFWSKCSVCD